MYGKNTSKQNTLKTEKIVDAAGHFLQILLQILKPEVFLTLSGGIEIDE